MKKPRNKKFIFVVGGVMSSVGKGVLSASLGAILSSKGFKVTAIKADPYINVDAGTMNPTEHGEVFVTDDGDETDQDMGNYERFLGVSLTKKNYMTTGRVYLSVIERERSMGYKGRCVEVVPHIPEEIIKRIKIAAEDTQSEVTIIEIGGTVGEYQNILFLEAGRMLKMKYPNDVAFILVSYLPIPSHVGEMKTKPTQYASRTLNGVGIQADFIVARGEKPLDKLREEKLAVFCGIEKENAISAPDVESIYDLPVYLEGVGFGDKVLAKLGLPKSRKKDLRLWRSLMNRRKSINKDIKIAIVGKYFGVGDFTLADSYHSVIEAIKHASWANKRNPVLSWINSEDFENDHTALKKLKDFDGILVPGGFGSRGIEGVLMAIKFARENMIPYFGLCYGMQLAAVEIARSAGLADANTVEIDPETKNPIIIVNPTQQKNIKEAKYGGSLRLGAYSCALKKGTIVNRAYDSEIISERHRHRFEFNNDYIKTLEDVGVVFSGINPESGLVEIIELKKHPWFVGVQFHPEFKSRPLNPHPLFVDFIKAAVKKKS